jgi:hypothetical protein
MRDSICPACKAVVPGDRLQSRLIFCPSCKRALTIRAWLYIPIVIATLVPAYWTTVQTGLREWPFILVFV